MPIPQEGHQQVGHLDSPSHKFHQLGKVLVTKDRETEGPA